MSKMTEAQEKGIFKAAVVVHDEAGLPNPLCSWKTGNW